MYKLISYSKGSDDLSTGFHRNIDSREKKLIIKQQKNYLARIILEDVFGFAEHLENATYGLGCNFTLIHDYH